MEEKFVFSTDLVNKIKKNADEGWRISRQEKYWFKNIPVVRRSGLVFKRTNEETIEYMKCKLGVDDKNLPYMDPDTQKLEKTGIQYFSEEFCKIKKEDGSIGNMKLRDYQDNILNMFMDNDRSILMASRQVGKCVSFLTDVETDKGIFKLYELYYNFVEKKTIYDKMKFFLYKLIDKLYQIQKR